MTSEAFSPLNNREPISRIIAAKIEEAILLKKYPPGSKLPSEAELCEQFNVSRTPLREALQSLSALGFVKIQKGKGVFVENLSSDSVTNSMLKFFEHRLDGDYAFDLVHARQMIEPSIAYTAALNRTDDDLKELQDSIDGMEINLNNDYSFHTQFDLKFHLDLAYATQNKFMPLLLKPIHQLIPNIKSNILTYVEDARISALEWHKNIFECVIRREAENARLAMVEHLNIAKEHLVRALEKQKAEPK
ncbi:MAG: FadR family transcriptional regulator [Bacteroidetes bacterium]|nr:FadR family transcriptional regulator [Bacteroidota bacterium]